MTASHGSSQLDLILMTSPGTSWEDATVCHLPPLTTSAVVSYFVTYMRNISLWFGLSYGHAALCAIGTAQQSCEKAVCVGKVAGLVPQVTRPGAYCSQPISRA